MGVINKFLKYQKNLNMDLTTKVKVEAMLMERRKAKQLEEQCSLIKSVQKVEEEEQKNQDITEDITDFTLNQNAADQQITTEYITHLCKFLAENARKKRMQTIADNSQIFTSNEENYDTLPILSENVNFTNSNISNKHNVSKIQKNSHIPYQKQQQQFQNAKGNKRDILLKIRHHIFERQRQRQMALVQRQLVVWRPW